MTDDGRDPSSLDPAPSGHRDALRHHLRRRLAEVQERFRTSFLANLPIVNQEFEALIKEGGGILTDLNDDNITLAKIEGDIVVWDFRAERRINWSSRYPGRLFFIIGLVLAFIYWGSIIAALDQFSAWAGQLFGFSSRLDFLRVVVLCEIGAVLYVVFSVLQDTARPPEGSPAKPENINPLSVDGLGGSAPPVSISRGTAIRSIATLAIAPLIAVVVAVFFPDTPMMPAAVPPQPGGGGNGMAAAANGVPVREIAALLCGFSIDLVLEMLTWLKKRFRGLIQ